MSKISLGIGLTNACNLNCAHCYRPRGAIEHLGLADVVRCLEAFDVGSVNLGTGENILNPALPEVLDELHRRGLRTSLTSNGLSLLEIEASRLSRLHDVEVSFDFASPEQLDAFRGPGAWSMAVRAVERCVELGLKVTVLAVLMSINHDQLAAIARLATSLGAHFRVNVYQPVHDRQLMPSPEQFWDAFRRMFAETALVTCTEPVVAAVLAHNAELDTGADKSRSSGCGHTSVRLTPSGDILPCVYWPRAAAQLAELSSGGGKAVLASDEFRSCRSLPADCVDCPLEPLCGGGCGSRRALTVGVDQRDPYCPLAQGEPVQLQASAGADIELLHAANVCTTIVRAS